MTVEIERRDYITGRDLSGAEYDVYQACREADAERLDLPEIKPHLDGDYDQLDLVDLIDALVEKDHLYHGKCDTYNGPEHWFEVRERDGLRVVIHK